jgi:serine phosphatase RsbU (regulator of sigma subunit)
MASVPLRAMDRLLLYTDGVTDVLANGDGEAAPQLLGAIERAGREGAPVLDTVLSRVHQTLAGHQQPDDLTLMMVSLQEPFRARTAS